MEWLKELLKNAGIDESKIESFVTEFNKEVPKHFIPKDTYNQLSEAKKKLDTDLQNRDKQLADLKKNVGDNEELKKQIQTLQDKNKTDKEEYEKQLKETQLTSAIRLALIGKVHDADLVAGLIEKDKIELGDDGNISKGLDDQIKTLKESKSFLFVPEKQDTQKFKGFVPSGGNGGGDPNVDIGSNFAKMANEKSQTPNNENGPWT